MPNPEPTLKPTDEQIIGLVNLVADLVEVDALDRAIPEVRATIAAWNARPTPSEEEVERVAVAIEMADIDRNIPEGTIDNPRVSSWGEHLARVGEG